MKRIYDSLIQWHFNADGEMMFIEGPRQVGKTTTSFTAQNLTDKLIYLNWDDQDHRKIILSGPSTIASHSGLDEIYGKKPIIIFDEIHKFKKWKNFLKGFYDTYHDRINIIVTGSSRLGVYKPGGDSLMGRYFRYRVHPLSVAECIGQKINEQEIQFPHELDEKTFLNLYRFGGFPKPFLKHSSNFSIRWQQLRQEQLIREDIRDSSRIHEIAQLELLTLLLREQAGQLLNYSNLAVKVQVSSDTIRRWIKILEAFYFCFLLKPWRKNVIRSLIKEPKVYLWDWATIEDEGIRAENFIASHLLKAVHFWTDLGLGNFELYFLRTKEQKEIDFLVCKNNKPWFLVETKLSDNQPMSKTLIDFQKKLSVPHAFQVVFNKPYVDKNCFEYYDPVIVPARTFLSQLV